MKKISSKTRITLDWYQDIANVIEYKNGQSFEIGIIKMISLVAVIVGCTYYHHLIPILDVKGNESFQNYNRGISSYQRRLKKIINKIRKLHEKYPEISEKGLGKDDPNNPQFIDLAITIHFPVPIFPTDIFEQMVIDKITPYVELLKSNHSLELLKKNLK